MKRPTLTILGLVGPRRDVVLQPLSQHAMSVWPYEGALPPAN